MKNQRQISLERQFKGIVQSIDAYSDSGCNDQSGNKGQHDGLPLGSLSFPLSLHTVFQVKCVQEMAASWMPEYDGTCCLANHRG